MNGGKIRDKRENHVQMWVERRFINRKKRSGEMSYSEGISKKTSKEQRLSGRSCAKGGRGDAVAEGLPHAPFLPQPLISYKRKKAFFPPGVILHGDAQEHFTPA